MKESDIGALLRAQQLILSSDKDITTVGLDLVYRLLSSTAPSWLNLNLSWADTDGIRNRGIPDINDFRSYGTLITIPEMVEPLLIVSGLSTPYWEHGSVSDSYLTGLVYGEEVQARSRVSVFVDDGSARKIFRLAEESYQKSPAQVECVTKRYSAVETEKAILRYLGNK